MAVKIGIISDTHGILREDVKEKLKDCSYILHAGDFDRPEVLDELRLLGSIYAVRGNNDREWAQNLSRSLTFTIEGVKFFMVHNKKDVAWDLKDAQVVVYGHTHHYAQKEIDGRLWLNPGTCGRSYFGGELSMAILTLEDGCCKVEKTVLKN